MTLFGVSPLVFGMVAVALAAVVSALHLLRVRLRRVDVDTLLFFRLAGSVRQPRVLPGRPARWLAWLLATLAALAAWAAVADPRVDLQAPSRVVVLEPAPPGAVWEARLAALHEVLRGGLGPRGAVLAAAAPPLLLLRADEPRRALAERLRALPERAATGTAVAALIRAADQLGPADEVLWIGGPPPAVELPVPLRAVLRGDVAPLVVHGARWQRVAGAPPSLVITVTAVAGGEAALRTGEGEVQAELLPGFGEVTLGPLVAPPAPAAVPRLLLRAGATQLGCDVPFPAAAPLRVFLAADLPADLREVVAAAIAVDDELAPAADAGDADVLVAATDAVDERPRLVLTPGEGGGPRLAVLAGTAPLELSLRDRTRRDASALPLSPAEAGVTPWVMDAAAGGVLVAATRHDQRRRVHVVDWLLAPQTHADVLPLLVTALRALGGRPEAVLAGVGEPWRRPAAWADGAIGGALPVAGAFRAVAPPGRGEWRGQGDTFTVIGLPAAAPVAADAPDDPVDVAPFGGADQLLPWLLLVLLLVLAADGWLFQKGRLP